MTRFRVPEADAAAFRTGGRRPARRCCPLCPASTHGSLGRAPDDQDLWVLATAWEGVGAYRRALSAYDVKMTAPRRDGVCGARAQRVRGRHQRRAATPV